MGFFSSIGNFFKDSVGSVLGFAGDAVGGVLGLKGQKDTANTQAALAREQIEYQKELAKNQIQWRVEDAKKAGLHPLAGLGLSSASYSPVSMSSSSPDYSFLSDMGQNLNRSIMEGKTAKERQQALDRQAEIDKVNLRKANAEADLAETTAASERLRLQRELSPPSPPVNRSNGLIEGQGDAPFLDKPIVRDGWLLDEYGRKVGIIPSEDLSDRTEDKFIVEWVPWAGSSIRAARAKFLGQKVNGHWWHGDDLGFLPYPPKKSKGFFDYVRDVHNFYSDYDS